MDTRKLFKLLSERLSLEEIKGICQFVAGIDPEEFSGGKSDKLRQLLAHFERRKNIDDLLNWITKERPDIELEDIQILGYWDFESSELLTAFLIGSWNENYPGDIDLIQDFSGSNYLEWVTKIRELYFLHKDEIAFQDGRWELLNRKEFFKHFGPRIFDTHLDLLKSKIVEVLSEADPKFELDKEQRFAANIYGKIAKYSPELRKGLSVTLALLGNNTEYLENCSRSKPQFVVATTVRAIFDEVNWKLLASLDGLFPTIAEASPNEFLNILEAEINNPNNSIVDLFREEESGVLGSTYHSGILRALETLAWIERYFVRVCVLLGDLAIIDPGGKTSDRPQNLLTTIFLPWLPQTTAPLSKRKSAVNTLKSEAPDVAWHLLKSLFPGQNQSSMYIQKPIWIYIPEVDLERQVSSVEYEEQMEFYINAAISMAEEDFYRLVELAQFLSVISPKSLDKILELMSSTEVSSKSEEKRNSLWNKLIDQISHHRQFAHAKWAMDETRIEQIESVANKLAPEKPSQLYQRLFNNRDHEHFEKRDNYEERRKELEAIRIDAVQKIINDGGLDQVVFFANQVEAPRKVGYALSRIVYPESDEKLLPNFLDKEDWNIKEFISGYIWGSQNVKGLNWVDSLDRSNWSSKQVCQFLIRLPFENETWNRAPLWLGDSESGYWFKVAVHPFHAQSNLGHAVDKLLVSKRPIDAIDCLLHMKQAYDILDKSRIVKALLEVVQLKETPNHWGTYQAVQLIKALQESPDGIEYELFKIEWAYLPLLAHDNEASPITLESRLASDSNFFCEVIRLLYRSKFVEKSPQQKAFAVNAWELLKGWPIVPGTDIEGTFSKEIWLFGISGG
jgi:hypothetical protein